MYSGGLRDMGPEEKEVINGKTMRNSDGYSDVSVRNLSGLNATSHHSA